LDNGGQREPNPEPLSTAPQTFHRAVPFYDCIKILLRSWTVMWQWLITS